MDYAAHFVRDPGTCGGKTVFRGTRVLLRAVLADLSDGASTQDVLKDFPSLTTEHVRAAIAFAAAAARDNIRAKVKAGLHDLDAGDAVPHDQVMREAAKRLRKIKGRPVAAVTPLDEGDWERLVVSCHPAFRSIIEQSRERCRAGQGISTEEMWRRLKRRRAAAAARPSSRRAPRPARRSRPSKRR